LKHQIWERMVRLPDYRMKNTGADMILVTEKQVTDFFSFCGKIRKLELVADGGKEIHIPAMMKRSLTLIFPDKQKAIITFERPSAARTALLLQDAHLGTSQVHVSSSVPLDGSATPPQSSDKSTPGHDFSQEDKPRTAVLAGKNSQILPFILIPRILVPRIHSDRSSPSEGN